MTAEKVSEIVIQALGCGAAWVGTEEGNVAARRLYASVGGTEEPAVIHTFALEPAAKPPDT